MKRFVKVSVALTLATLLASAGALRAEAVW